MEGINTRQITMEYAMRRHDFSCTLHRVERDDRILTHLLLCEPPTTVIPEGPHFDMTHIKEDGPGLKKICDAIGRNTHLRDVCFDAPLGLSDMVARPSHFDGLKRNKSIRSLGLSRCDLNHGLGREVLEAFKENHLWHLTKLAVWRCVVRYEGPDALATMMAKCMRLRKISLSSCGINDNVVEKLAESLKGHRELITLDLQDNHIRRAGCQALAALLLDPECTVVDLDLHNNMIDNCGAKAVADDLADNKKLEVLCLDENYITADGWNTYIQILCDTSSISATYECNHVLHTIASYSRLKVASGRTHDNNGLIPDRLLQLLALNGRVRGSDPGHRRVHAARQKVLDAHFRGDFDMAPFSDGGIDPRLLPHVLGWVGRDLWAQRCCYVTGRTAVYELLRRTPTLCEMTCAVEGFVEETGPGATVGDEVAAGHREKRGPASRRSRLSAILARGMRESGPFTKLMQLRSRARHRQSGKNAVYSVLDMKG